MNLFDESRFPEFPCDEDELDAAGCFRHFMETPEQFQARGRRIAEYLQRAAVSDEFSALMQGGTPVPREFISAAAEEVRQLYDFSPKWIPCFFHTGQTGHFSAGVLLEIDDLFPVICIHDAFQDHRVHRGYTITETIAHEMVHAARIGFPPSAYEEYFPCQVHRRSAFRRIAGNFFRNWKIPVLFLTGFLIGCLSIFPECRFCASFFLLPGVLMVREWYLHRILNRAEAFLRRCGLRALPVLVRMTDPEIYLAAKGILKRDFKRFAK